MTDAVSAISRLSATSLGKTLPVSPSGGSGSSVSFGQLLGNALDELNQTALASDELAESFAAGEDVEIHEVMIAMQETQIAFDLATQVRNKAVEAYQEILRLQL
ncbi:MAG: flagellar hook-basal body complex protein FliE [Anaerolineae bacterium]